MRNKLHKALATIVIFATILSIAIPSFASTDYDKHGAKAQIQQWMDKGVVTGNGKGIFNPEKPITRAEFAAIIQRVFNYQEEATSTFTDVASTKWYAKDISKAVAAGVLTGSNGKAAPEQNITREQAVTMLYRAFNLKATDPKGYEKFADKAEVSTYAQEAVSYMTSKSFIFGRSGNKFAPKANITKSEVVIILSRIVKELYNKVDTYNTTIEGTLVVNKADVVLKDMTIKGDLYLTQGIGNGNVTLDGVTVTGKTYVMGGGMNSIILKNTKLTGTLIVIKKDGKVRIVAQGSTDVANVQLESGAKLEEDGATGNGFGKVEIMVIKSGAEIILDGSFDEVSVEEAGAKVTLTDDTVVKTFKANAAVEVAGDGKIELLKVTAEGVKVETAPDRVELGTGITKVVIDNKDVTTSTGGTIGGGGTVTQSVTVSDVKLIVDGVEKTPAEVAVLDGTQRFSGVKFTTNVGTSLLHITSVYSPNTGTLTADNKLTFSSTTVNLSVSSLLGSRAGSHTDISLATLRDLCGSTITLGGTFEGTGSFASYTKYTSPISISIGTGTVTMGTLSDYVTLSYTSANHTLVANISDESQKQTKKLSELKTRAEVLIVELLGYLPAEASTNPQQVDAEAPQVYLTLADANASTNGFTDISEKASFLTALNVVRVAASKTALDSATSTLGDMAGTTLYCKRGTSPTVYTISIVS